jgi:hypothetical protein
MNVLKDYIFFLINTNDECFKGLFIFSNLIRQSTQNSTI